MPTTRYVPEFGANRAVEAFANREFDSTGTRVDMKTRAAVWESLCSDSTSISQESLCFAARKEPLADEDCRDQNGDRLKLGHNDCEAFLPHRRAFVASVLVQTVPVILRGVAQADLLQFEERCKDDRYNIKVHDKAPETGQYIAAYPSVQARKVLASSLRKALRCMVRNCHASQSR